MKFSTQPSFSEFEKAFLSMGCEAIRKSPMRKKVKLKLAGQFSQPEQALGPEIKHITYF